MKYCTVICDGKTEKWLLTVDKVQETISVEHCYFYNCTRFLFSRSSCTFRYCSFSGCSEFLWTRLANGYPIEFSNCNIVTPGEEFINDSGSVKLSACEILLIYRAKTSSKSGTRFIRGSNIDIFQCKVQGNLRFSSAEEAAGLKELYGLPHFTWGNTKITESSFYGVYGIAERDADAERCIFDNCMSLSLSTAQNCRFDRCMEVIDGNSVSNCQFNQCYGARLISTHLGGKIDLCEFNGWEAKRAKLNVASYSYRLEQEMRDIFLSAMITLELSNSSKNDKRCIISACTFNGMRTYFDKVIAPFFCNKATERKVELNKCRFINCATERKDQKMIQTSGHYSDFFKKERWITVIVVDDYKGLNQVWTDSTPNSYTVMTETVDGQTLGCNDELFETFSSGVLHMVDYQYNESIAAQILSGLYIQKGKMEAERDAAHQQYQILAQKTKQEYLLPFPQNEMEWMQWNPEWKKQLENDAGTKNDADIELESESADEGTSKETLELQVAKANTIVVGFAASTGATGAIPIPFADAPLLIAQQVAMMGAINAAFHIKVGKDVLKSLAMGAIGVSGATVIGRTVATSLIKLIPGAGTIMGGTAAAGTAAALTLALGKAYIGVCKSIKTGKLNLDELSQKKGQDVFKEAFRDEMKKKK